MKNKDSGCLVEGIITLLLLFLVFRFIIIPYGKKILLSISTVVVFIIAIFLLYLLIYKLLERLFSKSEYRQRTGADIVEVSIEVTIHFVLLAFLILSIYILYILSYKMVVSIILLLMVSTIVLFILATLVFRRTNKWIIKIYLRRCVYISYYLTILIPCVVALIFLVWRFFGEGFNYFTDFQYSICFAWGKVSGIVLIMCIGGLLLTMRKEYDVNRFVLFLRCFKYDRELRDAKILSKISTSYSDYRYTVMKIGDPNTIFSPRFDVDTYYLPTDDWKSELKKLIERSKYVVTALETSDGVLWEVFNNLEYSSKYIYYIYDFNKIEEILSSSYCRKFQNVFVVRFLANISKYNSENSLPLEHCAFMYRDGIIYYSDDISSLIKVQLGKKETSSVNHMLLD